jgi:2Fe-2S ferredoxin
MSEVTVNFQLPDGTTRTHTVPANWSVLEAAHDAGLQHLDGACGANMACATCHVILPRDWFAQLPMPTEEEGDMLDLAHGATETSRLGCQVIITRVLNGITVLIPAAAS